MDTHLEYMILEAMSIESLAYLVRQSVQDGWEPQGGVSATRILTPSISIIEKFYQAMVRYSVVMPPVEVRDTGELMESGIGVMESEPGTIETIRQRQKAAAEVVAQMRGVKE